MADITKFYTRVQLKYDTWANWNTDAAKAIVPLKGEVCLVEIPGEGTSNLNHKNATSVTKPAVLMKVGDGDTTFGELPWLSALAADVHGWAKKSEAEFKEWLDKTAKFATDDELATVSAGLDTAKENIKTLQEKMEAAEGAIGDLQKTDESYGERLEALETAVGSNEGNSLASRVGTLEQTLATEQGYIDTLQSAMEIVNGGEGVSGSIAKALKDAKDYSDSQDTAQTTALQGYADQAEADAIAEAKKYTDQRETAIKTLYEAADEAINAKLTTLIASDTGKSVRTIANEELAAQLLSGEADADFKTLQELAAWLEDHPEDAAAMSADILAITKEIYGTSVTDASEFTGNSRIDLLETNLSGEVSARENAVKGVQDQIDALKGSGEGSVSEQIADAVATAKTQWEAYADKAEEDAISSAATTAQSKVDNEKSRAEGVEAGLQNQIKTLVGSENGSLVAGSVVAAAIATAKSEAIGEAANDASSKAGTAKSEAIAAAKKYTDDEIAELSAALDQTNAGIAGRVTTLEEAVEDLTKDSVDSRISAAEGRAAADATSKANTALADAKTHVSQREAAITQAYTAITDGLDNRLDVIEGADTVQGSIAYAVKAEKDRAELAESGLSDRIKANEDKLAGITEATVKAHVAAEVKKVSDSYIAADDAIKGRLDVIESTDVTKAGSIAKAVNDEKVRAEAAELALSNRATALETAVGKSTDSKDAAGSLYARTAQNAADIATLDSDLDAVAARPFVKIANNSKTQYVVFYCGSATEMIDEPTLVEP